MTHWCPHLVLIWILTGVSIAVVGAWWIQVFGSRKLRPWTMTVGAGLVALSALALARSLERAQHVHIDSGAPPFLWALARPALSAAEVATVVSFVSAAWIVFWVVRTSQRRPLSLLVWTATAAAPLVWSIATFGRARREVFLLEPNDVLLAIGRAQEAYREETGSYCDVSTALGSNADNAHGSLYPAPPAGYETRAWGIPCAPEACHDRDAWARMPLEISGGVTFGYSTVAGRAGERPTARVVVDGRPLNWPTPNEDWYVVTAVGDPEGSGKYVTLVLASFWTGVLIDQD